MEIWNLCKKAYKRGKTAGFDAVKFQKRDINVVYSQEYLDSPRKSPWGENQRAQKEALEFSFLIIGKLIATVRN